MLVVVGVKFRNFCAIKLRDEKNVRHRFKKMLFVVEDLLHQRIPTTTSVCTVLVVCIVTTHTQKKSPPNFFFHHHHHRMIHTWH